MRSWRCLPFLFVVLTLTAQTPTPPHYIERELFIPWTQAAPTGLDALLVYADVPGKQPLVVITHGSSRKPEEHAEVTPWAFLPQAQWFARRGWVALVVVRRGYGHSGGEQDGRHAGHCPTTDYQAAAEYAAQDLRVALDFGRSLPNVDPQRAIAVGVSTGGLATVALTAQAPPQLVAAINFAGGRGSRADHDVCNPDDLVRAYKNFGKHSRVPMLWLYAQNDKFFWPELAQKFDAAFRSQGGNDQFVLAPPIGDDGHSLFRRVSAWSDTVDAFLIAHQVNPLPQPFPEIHPPDIPPPPGLTDDGLRAWGNYLLLGPHKAFAVSPHFYGVSVAQMTTDDAKHKAIDSCRHKAPSPEDCVIFSVDNTGVAHP
ncbi:MAG: dienelactone hydrolase family protein [Acidobacteriaceae bacterium]